MGILASIWDLLILNPMMNGLVVLYSILGHSFGMAIIVFTMLVRAATIKLTLRQLRSTRKMTELQPRLRIIQSRYAKDKARISQETMRLYKESGVNPLGCLGPMVIQFPIWIGLYMSVMKLLPTSPENLAGLAKHLYSWRGLVDRVVPINSHFLWLDLAVPDTTYVMPILVGISMWTMQKMTTMPTPDPRQQSTNRMMLWMMPFMFAFLSLTFPSGLPLYWLVSNIAGMFIQYFVTGWGGLLPTRAAVASGPTGEEAPNENLNSSPEEEPSDDGDSGYERQDDRGSGGARAKRTRRRARGSRRRGS